MLKQFALIFGTLISVAAFAQHNCGDCGFGVNCQKLNPSFLYSCYAPDSIVFTESSTFNAGDVFEVAELTVNQGGYSADFEINTQGGSYTFIHGTGGIDLNAGGITIDYVVRSSKCNTGRSGFFSINCSVVCNPALVGVYKTAHTDTVSVGDSIHWTIAVFNTGCETATGISVIDTLTGSVIYVPPPVVSQGMFDLLTATWTVGDILGGDTATMQVTTIANATGLIINKAFLQKDTTVISIDTVNVIGTADITANDDEVINTEPGITATVNVSLNDVSNACAPESYTFNNLINCTVISLSGGVFEVTSTVGGYWAFNYTATCDDGITSDTALVYGIATAANPIEGTPCSPLVSLPTPRLNDCAGAAGSYAGFYVGLFYAYDKDGNCSVTNTINANSLYYFNVGFNAGSGYLFSIDWGDGNNSTNLTNGIQTHTYTTAGSYTITVTSDCDGATIATSNITVL